MKRRTLLTNSSALALGTLAFPHISTAAPDADDLISRVPLQHAGAMRRVYPGLVQVSAVMSMSPERHKASFRQRFEHLENGLMEEVVTIQPFYEEYFTVNDLPAEFCLETVEKVFQT